MKKIILIITFFCLSKLMAQQAVVSTGGNAAGTGGRSSYSIGQVACASATGTNGSVNQGVQQPFEIFTLGNDDFPEITLQMTVYPNPTKALVNLKIENYLTDNLQFQLFDLKGIQIQSQKIQQSETPIQLENLAAAIYLLNVLEENKLVKTFKIIKN